MIGVLAHESENAVISEFFELFKTPWEFYRAGAHYDVLICSETSLPKNSAKLVLIYGDKPTAFDNEHKIGITGARSPRILVGKEDRIPIYGRSATLDGSGDPVLKDEKTFEPAAMEFRFQGQKIIRLGFNLFFEIEHLLRQGQPTAYAAIPTLDLHIALLRNAIIDCALLLAEVPPLPANYNFIVCLTHDVDHAGIRHHKCDHTIIGFLFRATVGSLINLCRGRTSIRHAAANWMAAFSLPLIYLGWLKDFWSRFDRYLDLEKDLTSTFYIVPKKGTPGDQSLRATHWKRATKYDVTDIPEQIERLTAAGREIGLHGLDAWCDSKKAKSELETIAAATGEQEIGVRMHWLYFNENSPGVLDRSGFSYDSTIGYNETVGYRAGTAQIFKPLDAARMLELPMHVMDTALFYPQHMNLSPKEARSTLMNLAKITSRVGGVLTINWHDRSIAPERLWTETYVGLIEELKRGGAWFATAKDAVSWFRKRRSVTFEVVPCAEAPNRIRTNALPSNDKSPALRLRIYNSGSHAEAHANRSRFVETTFSKSDDVVAVASAA
jgi:hypothetical protein